MSVDGLPAATNDSGPMLLTVRFVSPTWKAWTEGSATNEKSIVSFGIPADLQWHPFYKEESEYEIKASDAS